MSTRDKLMKILSTARPRFLLLTPCCLSLALAMAIAEGVSIDYGLAAMILIGALAAHASVNMFNEYGDFINGLDFQTQRTPFSGGTGTLPGAPELANSVRLAAFLSLAVTAAIGGYFIRTLGWGLLPVGLVGVMLIYFYTQNITHRPLLCLVAPGLGFGPLMIGGAYYALSGQHDAKVWLASFSVFFLVSDLLLLNQFPDVEPDRRAGRYHLPIAIGRKRAAWVYVGFLIAAYATLALSVWLMALPYQSLAGFLTLALAVPASRMALAHADDVERLLPALALNVGVTLLTPLLMAAGVFLHAGM